MRVCCPRTCAPAGRRSAPPGRRVPMTDELPEDLDVTAYVGPYTFPNITRRRIPGVIYTVVGLTSLVGWLRSDNGGLLFAGLLLLAIAAYHFVSAWSLRVDQTEALCLLYTSDAADDLLCVDLGGRR